MITNGRSTRFGHRFRLVEDALYDMINDPGQNKDVSTQFPEIAKRMKDAYEKFWNEARPLMINEDVPSLSFVLIISIISSRRKLRVYLCGRNL